MASHNKYRFVVTLVIAAVVLNLVAGYLLVSVTLDDRRQLEAEARLKARNLAELVDRAIGDAVSRIDAGLRELAGSLEQGPFSGTAETDRPAAAVLARGRALLGRHIGLSILDADGQPIGAMPAEAVATAREEELARSVDPGLSDPGPSIAGPVTDPATGQSAILLSRPFRAPDGRIAGRLEASVPVAMLTRHLTGLDLESQGSAALWDSTAALIARQPPGADPDQVPGSRIISRELADIIAAHQTAGIYRDRQLADGVERINAYRRLSAVPLHLVIGLAVEDYLQPWRGELLDHMFLGGLFFVVTLFSAALMWSRYSRAEESRGLLRTLMNAIPDPIWLKDPNGVYIACNPRFEQFFGKPEGDIVGRDDYQFMTRDLAEFFRGHDRLAVEADGPRMNEEWLTFAEDGYQGLFETIKTPIKTSQGKLIGVLGIARDITRQREAIAALRAREEIYASIVEQAIDGIVLIDPKTYGFVEFNAAACRLLGYTRAEFAALDLFDVPADASPERLRDLVAETLAQGEGHFELAQRHKDGSIRDTWISYRAIQIQGRTLISAIWRDMTERKAAEAALRDSERRSRIAQEGAGVGIWDFDLVSGQVYWSAEAKRLYGVQADNSPGLEDWRRIVHPDDLPAIDAQWDGAIARGEPFEVEFRIRLDDGGVRWLVTKGRAQYDANGRPLRLSGINLDITEKKRLAAELDAHRHHLEQLVRRRTADLEATHAKLLETQFAMDSVGIGITWADFATGRFIHANRFSADFLGYRLDELLNLRVWDIDPNFPPDVYMPMVEEIKRRGYLQFETEQKTRNGRLRPVEMTIYYHTGGAGSAPRLIAFMSDIARRKEAEAALRQAKEASEAANAAKSEFLANMSHEIRTPLNAILGLNYLLKKEDPSPAQRERLDKMEIAGRHLLSLINDILDLSKIEAGRMDLEHGNFHLSAVLDNVASIIRDAAANKGLTLAVNADGVPLWLWGDVTRLRQALLNFASNAVKFTDRGRICLRSLLLDERGDDLTVRFEVEDSGIGLDPEQQRRIFQAFAQADGSTARKFGGTGLGLALTKRLVELMGGSVGLNSAPGVGSTFWFVVPLQRGHGPMPVLPAASALTGAEPRLRERHRGARVLLAEDNAINIEVVLEMLHAVGIDVTVAENGSEAVDRARHQTFDLILMDMQMPELSGIEATRLIRTFPHWAERPIVALTANAFAEDRQACLAAGMNDMLTKPIEPDLLYATLLRWLAPSARGAREFARTASATEPETDDAPVLQALRALPGVDVEGGLAMLRGGGQKYLRLVRQFVAGQGQQVPQIETLLDAGDRVAARRLAHSLKGSAATLHLTSIAEAAARLERLLATEDEIASRRDAIAAGVEEILTGLRVLEPVLSARHGERNEAEPPR